MSTTKAEVELPKFIAGGVIAAVIAAFAGLVTRGIINALLERDPSLTDGVRGGDLLVPTSLGSSTYEVLGAGQTVVVSLVLGIAATVVLYLFVMVVPRPLTMFSTLGGLFLAASMLPILTFDDPPVRLALQVGLAVLHLVVGLTILGLLSGVARSTVRFVRVPDEHDRQQGYQQPRAGYQAPQQPGQAPPQQGYPQQQPPPQQPPQGGYGQQ